MKTVSWTLWIVTTEGRKVPHWTADTRERCRAERRSLGHLPRGVRALIERNAPDPMVALYRAGY